MILTFSTVWVTMPLPVKRSLCAVSFHDRLEITLARTAGTKNRNYPGLTLEQALAVPRAIQDGASGMTVSKLSLAELVGNTPNSSTFRELLLASRAYGLTTGGVNGDEFGLTDLGTTATCGDTEAELKAWRAAVMNVAPFREFLTQFNGKKVPATSVFAEFLVKSASVPQERAPDCIAHILADARFVGFFRSFKGSEYVALQDAPSQLTVIDGNTEREPDSNPRLELLDEPEVAEPSSGHSAQTLTALEAATPKSVFVAHGKNRKPLEQLKDMLKEVGVPFEVAVDEAHAGRPVSEKVATMMRDRCSSAIIIFSGDEQFFRVGPDGEQIEIWRPSENAVYELGAASVLYGRRIIIFKEDKVTLPSDFRDLGYISFHGDEIQAHWTELLRELKAHGIVEIRVAA
jgi:predicted nucleotide-binding protein